MSEQLTFSYAADTGEIALGQFQLASTGLVVRGRPTFEEWARCGAFLRRVEGAVQFWIGDWLNYGEKAYGEKYTHALQVTGLDEGTLRNYAHVASRIELSLRNDNVPYHVHMAVAPLDRDKQSAWIERAATEHLTVAEVRTALRLARRREQFEAGDLPRGKFRVVYADPPWAYNDAGVIVNSDAYGRAERHYPTMSLEELCAIPVIDHVEDEAVLFLWVTSPLLAECWPVIEAWGFTYKTSMVWDKQAHNFGHYVSVRHELLLICTRGSCTPDHPVPMPASVIAERRSEEHSEKPVAFRRVIEGLYPYGRRLELFGRREIDGWTVYGNQLSPISV